MSLDRATPRFDQVTIGGSRFAFTERFAIDLLSMQLSPGPVVDGMGHTWYQLSLAALRALYGDIAFPRGIGWGWCEWHVAPNPGAATGAIAVSLHDVTILDPDAIATIIQTIHVMPTGSRLYLASNRDSIWWAPYPLGAPGYGPLLGPAATWDPTLPAHNNYDAHLSFERFPQVRS